MMNILSKIVDNNIILSFVLDTLNIIGAIYLLFVNLETLADK